MNINLVATTFKANAASIPDTYGYRIYDDYAKAYDNNSESPIEDDLDLLEYALQSSDDEVKTMLDFVKEHQNGMNINGEWYDWDQIKECF